MAHPLTLKEEQLLCKIIDFVAKTGHAPSIREAQELGGFLSSRTAAEYLERLEAAEYIKRGNGGASPIGEDGLWPHEAVRDIIEAEESLDIERGITISLYNRRGTVSKDLREGGAQERELVRQYEGYSAAMADRWPRTAAMLRQIAASYKHEAQWSDTDVELRDHLE